MYNKDNNMITLPLKTVDDIEDALDKLGMLPREKRVDYLARARRKLLAHRRRGEKRAQRLHYRVQKAYVREKQALDRTSQEEEPQYEIVDKGIYDLEVGQATRPSSERYKDLMVARDEDGFYATDGDERTESYDWSGSISSEEIDSLVEADHS